jgi:hypothetical protein
MKVVDFISAYNAKKIANTAAVGEWIRKTLEVKDYVPFVEKRELCADVLNACNTIDDSGLVKVDSVSRYLIFTISVVSKYTNLEFSSGEDDIDSIDEYDMLCQHDLLNHILDVIGAEYTSCNNVLNMMMSDIVANNNTVENVLANAMRKITDSVGGVADTLSEKIASLELDLNQFDIDKFKGLLELIPKK